jgi:hypothetical protein
VVEFSFQNYFFLLQHIECSKSTLLFTILFFYISSIFQCVIKENCIYFPFKHHISEQREIFFCSLCKAPVHGHSLLLQTQSLLLLGSCMGWGWGGADKDGMVVAHATMHVDCQLARSLAQRLRPLELAVWAQNEASLLFVEAPVQLPDSWASCTLLLFISTCQKVFRPGPFMRTIISSSCPVRAIWSFFFFFCGHQ